MRVERLPDDGDGSRSVFERADGRTVVDADYQLHGVCTWRPAADGVERVRVMDTTGNIGMCVTVGELIEWLDEWFSPDTPLVLELDGEGPEGGVGPLFERVTAFDDPDPYDTCVIRATPSRPSGRTPVTDSAP